MRNYRHLTFCAGVLFAALFAASLARSLENINMNPSISVEGGKIVAHWNAQGFDHYNIRWSENRGSTQQIERDGDKNFVYLTDFRPGVVYTISVQGCESHALSRSQCTSWDEISCGVLRNPCDGLSPRPMISGGGLCLDVHAPDQHRNGGRVQLWACNGSDQQLWTVRGKQIVSLAGKCLDVDLPELQKNGGRVQVWDCNGSVQQRWNLQRQQLRSEGGKCLDAQLPTLRKNGGMVQIWDCNGAPQQNWSQPSAL